MCLFHSLAISLVIAQYHFLYSKSFHTFVSRSLEDSRDSQTHFCEMEWYYKFTPIIKNQPCPLLLTFIFPQVPLQFCLFRRKSSCLSRLTRTFPHHETSQVCFWGSRMRGKELWAEPFPTASPQSVLDLQPGSLWRCGMSLPFGGFYW